MARRCYVVSIIVLTSMSLVLASCMPLRLGAKRKVSFYFNVVYKRPELQVPNLEPQLRSSLKQEYAVSWSNAEPLRSALKKFNLSCAVEVEGLRQVNMIVAADELLIVDFEQESREEFSLCLLRYSRISEKIRRASIVAPTIDSLKTQIPKVMRELFADLSQKPNAPPITEKKEWPKFLAAGSAGAVALGCWIKSMVGSGEKVENELPLPDKVSKDQ